MSAYRPLSERFFEKVRRSDGCWEWTAFRNAKGYGSITERGATLLAHRVSWEIHNGAIPTGMMVLHSCDNPRCVRPSHLFIGTAADNNSDMRRKGRASGGRTGGKRVLTWDLVRAMRLEFTSKQAKSASIKYETPYAATWHALKGDNWKEHQQ